MLIAIILNKYINNLFNDRDMQYIQHKFYNKQTAFGKQDEIAQKLGYKPEVFEISENKKRFFSIIEPKNGVF